MLGNDFDIPVMYQDLANYSMGPMANPYAMGAASQFNRAGSYLGGVQMQKPLGQDKLEIMNRKKTEDKNVAKKVLLGLGAVFALGFIPVIAKGIRKSGGVGKYLKNIFSGKKGAQEACETVEKKSFWQKIKAKFSRKKTDSSADIDETVEKKSWWKRFKENFSRKKTDSTADVDETVEKKSWWQKLKEKFSRKKDNSTELHDDYPNYDDIYYDDSGQF